MHRLPSDEKISVPVLPLRDVVVYPHMVLPLFVGRPKSIRALDAAMSSTSKQVLLVAQKTAIEDNPAISDLYEVGTLSTLLQLLKLPDGSVKVLVEGTVRAKVDNFEQEEPYIQGMVHVIEHQALEEAAANLLIRTIISQFERYVKLNRKIPPEIVGSIASIHDPSRVADTIAAHMNVKIVEKQKLLEFIHLRDRYEYLMGLLESEIDLLQVEHRIRGNVSKRLQRSQREYYLNEQMKAIQEELGHESNDLEDIRKKIDRVGMPKEAKDRVLAELHKLSMMSPMSAEATVSRNYVDWMLNVPWSKSSKLRIDLAEAEAILNEDHYGLEKVKERILEYLAVQKRVKKLKGPILCLVGPPGVGKTSLGKSIARATKRKFERMSLGGVRDEAEIRGHRRTYIGSMPGKILQKLAKAEVNNPLFLLDEIDKMAMDFRGDPASALLEVLDPEQNAHFNDHYLEVDYDLSNIMFVATANSLNIPSPLLDRMEVIRLAGYTEDEKLAIAQHYLLSKQGQRNGLEKNELILNAAALLDIIRYYTREAGVRNLEREISKICRKVVKELLSKPAPRVPIEVGPEQLEHYLGVRRFRFGRSEDRDQVGQVTGLAWTEVGGDILSIEAVAVKGKGRILRTGHLGEVMQESIQAALTVVRSRAQWLGIHPDFNEKIDVHVHVPEGATPKDGPSAGIGMCVALVSALTKIPVRAEVAMTGEITLRGEVLPIGGLKEKLLAARRGGISQVIIPEENRRDLKDIPANILRDLKIHCVTWIDEVLQLALATMPVPLSDEALTASSDPSSSAEINEDDLATAEPLQGASH